MFLGFDSNIKWLDLQIKYHSLFNNRGFSHKAFWVGGWGMIGGIGGVPNGFIIGWWSPRRSWTENTCESPCNTTGRRFLLTMEGKSDLDGCCFGPRFIRSPSRTTIPGASSMASIWSTKMRKLQKITKWSKWYWKTRNVYYFYILIAFFFGRLNGKEMWNCDRKEPYSCNLWKNIFSIMVVQKQSKNSCWLLLSFGRHAVWIALLWFVWKKWYLCFSNHGLTLCRIGKSLAQSNFDWCNMADTFCNLYCSIL